jgi:hypothetical protein
MVGFGYKTAWLAIRDGDKGGGPEGLGGGKIIEEVVRALGGQVDGTIAWLEGVHASYDRADTVVATPPLPGTDGLWTLVTGWYLASNHEALDAAALSVTLAREVQLFVSHRVVELHRWQRSVGGTTVRSFEYLGETGEVRAWSGEPDETELAIGLPASFDLDRADDHAILVGEDDVMRVAGAWSVDPTSLENRPATAPLTLARFPAP